MSLSLISNTDSLQVVLDATPTNQCPVNCTFAQQGGVIGEARTTTNGATAVTLLTGPSSGNGYAINSIQFPNIDTAQRTLTVNKVTSAGTQLLYKATLSAGSALMYDGGAGWYVMDQFGNRLSSASLPAGVTLTTPNITGVTNGSNATAGSVGEIMTASGTGVALSNNVSANLCSVTLTPGDWQVYGNALITGSALTAANAGVNTTSGTSPGTSLLGQYVSSTTFSAIGWSVPTQRFSISANTTIYLVGTGAFSSGSCAGNGSILARRER